MMGLKAALQVLYIIVRDMSAVQKGRGFNV